MQNLFLKEHYISVVLFIFLFLFLFSSKIWADNTDRTVIMPISNESNVVTGKEENNTAAEESKEKANDSTKSEKTKKQAPKKASKSGN